MGGRMASGPSACSGRGCTCCREMPFLLRRVEQLERDLREERARAQLADVKNKRLQAEVHVLEREVDKMLQQDLQHATGGAHSGVAGGGPRVGAGVNAALATPDGTVPQSPQQLTARAAGDAVADGAHGAHEAQHHEQQHQHDHQEQQARQQPQQQSPTPQAAIIEHSPDNEGRRHGHHGWLSLKGGPAGVGAGVASQRAASPPAGPAVTAGAAAAQSPHQHSAGHKSDTSAASAAAAEVAAVAAAATESAIVPTAAMADRTAARSRPHGAACAAAAAAAAQGGQDNPSQAHIVKADRSAGGSGKAYGAIGGSAGLDGESPEGSISFGFRGGGSQGAAAASGQADSASDAVGVNVECEYDGEPSLVGPAAGRAAARVGAEGLETMSAAVASDPAGQGTQGPARQMNTSGAAAGAGGGGGGGAGGGGAEGGDAEGGDARRCGAGGARVSLQARMNVA